MEQRPRVDSQVQYYNRASLAQSQNHGSKYQQEGALLVSTQLIGTTWERTTKLKTRCLNPTEAEIEPIYCCTIKLQQITSVAFVKGFFKRQKSHQSLATASWEHIQTHVCKPFENYTNAAMISFFDLSQFLQKATSL